MPKESVYGTSEDGIAVKVGWSREHEHVQVGIGGPVEIQYLEPLPPGVSVAGPYDGMWVTLDRLGINTLIRHLRRARDAAYGRDE